MSIVTQVESITPSIARAYLAQNIDNNRHLSDRIVAVYAQQMQKGEWKFNGDSIRFDEKGRLIDGQHRLSAIAKAGITIECIVVRGLSSDSVESIDMGRKRTVGDVLKMQYGIGMANAKAGLAKALYLPYQETSPFALPSCSSSALTTHKIVQTYLTHRQAIDFVVAKRGNSSYPVSAIGSAIARAYYNENHEKLERFLTLLGTVTDCTERESAALRLRDYLLDVKAKGVFGRAMFWENFSVAQATLQAFLKGRKMTRRIVLFNQKSKTDKVFGAPQREINWLIPGFDDLYLEEWAAKAKRLAQSTQ